MRNRGCFFGGVAVLGMLAAWFVLRPGQAPTAREPGGGSIVQSTPGPMPTVWLPPAPTPLLSGASSKPASKPPRTAAAASDPRSPDGAQTEALKVHRMIVDYHTLMGGNPGGTNAEIMHAVMGGNPHQAQLGPPEGQTLNDKGELVDPWGTPYFFHQLSGDHMEVHSAGPDKIMGTADDVVIP